MSQIESARMGKIGCAGRIFHGRAERRPQFPPDGWQLGKPDLFVAGTPALSVFGWRTKCLDFIMPVPITAPRWLSAPFECGAGQSEIFHHAMFIVDLSCLAQTVRQRTPGVGFSRMDLSVKKKRKIRRAFSFLSFL